MFQTTSVKAPPVNAGKDNSELLKYELDTMKRKNLESIERRYGIPTHKILISKPDITALTDHYKALALIEHGGKSNKKTRHTAKAQLIERLSMAIGKVGTEVLSAFDNEINRVEKLVLEIIDEIVSTEKDIETVREMIKFMITSSIESQKEFHEIRQALQNQFDESYNAAHAMMNTISREWEDYKRLQVSEEEKNVIGQKLTQKQNAFKSLFFRAHAFRSTIRSISADISDEFQPSKATVAPVLRELSSLGVTPEYTVMTGHVGQFFSLRPIHACKDASIPETAQSRLVEDITVLSTDQLNYTTKLLVLARRACDCEFQKRIELQNVFILLSKTNKKDDLAMTGMAEMEDLCGQFRTHTAHFEECMNSDFDDVIELLQKPMFPDDEFDE
ncbi:hypothetical protein L5515_018914 [Caenorhabditis briggsae]|uniref:Uncharacterized protein n=1 Tax=Caenorhabditis briggsae TaxID=6238 RepID=A0AAE9FGZ3_CAEBR|nr:hypothetical protein L5515_018914 [Caenorhabditis briggsae]